MDPVVVTTGRLESIRLANGQKMVNHYVLDSRIGKGVHGIVWKCHDHLDERKIFAMKIVKRDNPRAKRERQYKQMRQQTLPPRTDHVPVVDGVRTAEQEIRKEIAIMKKCNHPHVVKLHEVIDDRRDGQIFMVIEYLGGGEVSYTNGDHQPILTVEQTRRVMRDAILGLEYLHHQGIIHRDIKPQNLIWTSNHDRVKIADFGTAHFSYAQRLAENVEGNGPPSSSEEDPILLNDADLAKRSGSPAFLAPEVVWEYTKDSSLPRPPVTKAIDIWALGVTLYCFLFGKIPFRPPGQYNISEWTAYDCTCNLDWRAPNTMGYDQVRSGGRHPDEDELESGQLGPVVIHLLDHFLKKDMVERITLDEVKENRWFLLDLPHPSTWLSVTSPHPIEVSAEETSDAMSVVRFRWSTLWPRSSRPSTAAISSTNLVDTATVETPAIIADPSTSKTATKASGAHGGLSITKRLTALLSRTPSYIANPTRRNPGGTLLGLRLSQNARRSKTKEKDMGDMGRAGSRSIPDHGELRRVRSDRDVEAERLRKEKAKRERELKKQKKAAQNSAIDTPPVKPRSNSRNGKSPEKEADSQKTPKPSAPPLGIPSSMSPVSAIHAPSPSRARSGSVRSIMTGEYRSPSPSGKRLTGLISSITHWRPSSRSSHTRSPVEERKDPKGKRREKFGSRSSLATSDGDSDIEFADPRVYQPTIASSAHDLRFAYTTTGTIPYHQQAPSPGRSSSSAGLSVPRDGSIIPGSVSTSPAIISPTFVTTVTSGAMESGPSLELVPSTSVSTASSSSSFGDLENFRRISSWDQGAAASGDPDSRSIGTSFLSDDYEGGFDDGVHAYDYAQTSNTQNRQGYGGIIFMRDEVDNYSDSSESDEGDDQATYEGTAESTVEGPPDSNDSSEGLATSQPAGSAEDEGLTFTTRRRREGR